MSKYLPFGKEILPTAEQINSQNNRLTQYEYYGIPYGELDGKDESSLTQKDLDREKARLLISSGKQLPKDLQERLFLYKQSERLTRKQMSEKYPNQWLGITNIEYENNDGVTLASADVIYTDKTCEELLEMQINGTDNITGWYTSENSLSLGLI